MEISDFFQFHKFLAQVLIKVVYWIGMFFILLGTLAGVLGTSPMSEYSSGGFGLGSAILSLIIGTMFALVWRVVCEIWIVIFSINDRLGILSGELPRKNSPTS